MRTTALLIAALALAGCAGLPGLPRLPDLAPAPAVAEAPLPDGAFRFVVVGDTPYGPEDVTMLRAAVPRIKALRPPFVIHVGDFKSGGAACDQAADDGFAALIADLAPIPVFYTPGDNDWTDCDRGLDPATGNPMSELLRLDRLRARFLAGAPAGSAAFGWTRQGTSGDNFTWRTGNIRFATVHQVGTGNGYEFVTGDLVDEAGLRARQRAILAGLWIDQAAEAARTEGSAALVIALQADPTDGAGAAAGPCRVASAGRQDCDGHLILRESLRLAAAKFTGPILVVHGDTSPFTLNRDFVDVAAPNLWRLNAAGDAGTADGGIPYGERDVTVVTVTPGSATPFAARGLLNGRVAGTD